MPHTKNNSMGYASTLLRNFPRTVLNLDDYTRIVIFPHEDSSPQSKVIPPFDMEMQHRATTKNDWRCTRDWPSIPFQQVKDTLELLVALHG